MPLLNAHLMEPGLKKLPCVYVSELCSFVMKSLLTRTHLLSAADCPSGLALRNGQVLISRMVFKSVATVNCDDGYKLVGNSTVVCQEDGTWSKTPECQGIPAPDLYLIVSIPN